MPNFSNITVVAIHGNNGIEKEIFALEKTAEGLPGCRTLLITNKAVESPIPQKYVWQELDYFGYSEFVIYCLHNYIETDYVLIVQSDGWMLNAENWRDEWYNYDYIGGWTHAAFDGDRFYKWYEYMNCEHPVRVVQNGGFSLRSKKFLEAPSKYGIVRHAKSNAELNNEDIQLCCFMRPALEKVGMKFAPESESKLFSFEHLHPILHQDIDLKKIFGHHSRFRRLVGNNVMEWRLSPEEQDNILWEDRVYELFRSYGYKIWHM